MVSVDEPENEVKEPYALKVKAGLGAFAVCSSDDEAGPLVDLWDHAFAARARSDAFRDRLASRLLQRLPRDVARASTSWRNPHATMKVRTIRSLARAPGRQQNGDQVMIKAVYSAFCLDWIADRWDPEVIVTSRHPFNVVSSWMMLGWKGYDLHDRPELQSRYVERFDLPRLRADASRVERLAWEVGLLTVAFEDLVKRHPSWHVWRHEDMCADPEPGFKALCDRLRLTWTDRAAEWLAASNAPGERFEVRRLAAEERDRWRQRLSPDEVSQVQGILESFPLELDLPERSVGLEKS